ncbi:hypothetical protein Tco_0771735 [Tanacetum coccineum]|uniref:Uncharacterized protein n=1 Tax=Tanacetum coccineum TaxID=301880 RepID=A0ABQ4ZFW5_9ASTR
MYYPRFTKVIIHYFLTQDKTVSWRNKIGMHTSKDDYLINTLRFVSTKEATQIYGAILPESLTISPEEPSRKSKRVKRPVKKSTKAPTGGVVIRETPEMSLSKKKEKMTVEKCKGIDLLSEVELTEEAQYEEVRKKSLRDFHKTHPSSSGTFTKTAPSDAKIKPSVTNERTGSDFEHETDENESGSESDQEENEEEIGDDEEEKEDEFVKTPSNNSDDEDEIKITDKAEGDEDEEMDYTTSQLYDDVDIRLNKLVQADDETVQKEGTDAEMINKTDVPDTSFSHSFDLAAKFFANIPTTEAKIISPMDVHIYHEVPSG